jgi:hypothetical protein
MRRLATAIGLAATVAAALPASGWAQPAAAGQSKPSTGKGDDCFYINQLEGNRALNDHAVLFRVGVNQFYRLDFAQRCYPLTYPDPKLIITPFGGVGLICHAIDIDVKVGQQGFGSFPEACIPSDLHHMTPAEVAAVPKAKLP